MVTPNTINYLKEEVFLKLRCVCCLEKLFITSLQSVLVNETYHLKEYLNVQLCQHYDKHAMV